MKNNYFKIEEKSETGIKLSELLQTCIRAEKDAMDYVMRVAGSGHEYYESESGMAGGIDYVVFKDEEKVDPRVWRKACVMDGKDSCYVPNVEIGYGVALLTSERFKPSDTKTREFLDEIFSFKQVFLNQPIEFWSQLSGIPYAKLAKEMNPMKQFSMLQSILGDKKFIRYREYRNKNSKDGKQRNDRNFARALEFEKRRLKLPVVNIESLYGILGAVIPVKPKKEQGQFTPVWFKHQGSWYISMSFDSNNKDLAKILEGSFKNIAKETNQEQ